MQARYQGDKCLDCLLMYYSCPSESSESSDEEEESEGAGM